MDKIDIYRPSQVDSITKMFIWHLTAAAAFVLNMSREPHVSHPGDDNPEMFSLDSCFTTDRRWLLQIKPLLACFVGCF